MNLSYQKLVMGYVIIASVQYYLLKKIGESVFEESIALRAIFVAIRFLPIGLALYKASRKEGISRLKKRILRIIIGYLCTVYVLAVIGEIVIKYT